MRGRIAWLLLAVLWWSVPMSWAAAPAPTGREEEAVLWTAAPATPAVPATPATPAVPAMPAVPAAPVAPALTAASAAGSAEPEAENGKRHGYRQAPSLPRNGDVSVILARLQRTVELLKEAIRMQEHPRTRDNVARADAVLYSAYKYLGAANTGIEIKIDRQMRGKKMPMKDPVLESALKTLEQVRGAHVRGAMNANQGADAVATVERAQAAIALIEQTMALVF